MASKRIISYNVVEGDSFLDLSHSSQLLYFHFLMNVDNEGFVPHPTALLRTLALSRRNFDELVNKEFIILFKAEKVVLISHWLVHNPSRFFYNDCAYPRLAERVYITKDGLYTTESCYGIVKLADFPEARKSLGNPAVKATLAKIASLPDGGIFRPIRRDVDVEVDADIDADIDGDKTAPSAAASPVTDATATADTTAITDTVDTVDMAGTVGGADTPCGGGMSGMAALPEADKGEASGKLRGCSGGKCGGAPFFHSFREGREIVITASVRSASGGEVLEADRVPGDDEYELYGDGEKKVVRLTHKQASALVGILGFVEFKHYVERLSDFVLSKNADIKNHYALILKWAREDGKSDA